jgi:two-component system, OmpR family, sensor kinase
VRSITQRHHGSVHCEDQEGGGACFTLRIPSHQV